MISHNRVEFIYSLSRTVRCWLLNIVQMYQLSGNFVYLDFSINICFSLFVFVSGLSGARWYLDCSVLSGKNCYLAKKNLISFHQSNAITISDIADRGIIKLRSREHWKYHKMALNPWSWILNRVILFKKKTFLIYGEEDWSDNEGVRCFILKTSQDLWMLSRSLLDCKSKILNVMIQVSQFVINCQLCH